MTYHNILSNPTLQTSEDNLHVETIHVLDYPPQYIYHPVQWKTTVTPTVRGEYRKRADDLHIIPTVWPQTVNKQRILTIEANTKHFVVKLEQFQIPLKAHQRYLVKVYFNPAVQPLGEATPTDLAWRLTVDKHSAAFSDGFQSAASTGDWGAPRSALLVVHSYEAQTVDLGIEFWSKFGNLDKQIFIHSVEMLEVEAHYGENGSVHFLGTPGTEPEPEPTPKPEPIPDPVPDPEPEPDLPAPMPWLLPLMVGVVGAILGAVLFSLIAPRMAAQGVAMEGLISIDQGASVLLTAILSLLVGLAGSPIVVNLTALIKRIPFMQNVKAEFIKYTLAALIMAGFWIAQTLGMEARYLTAMDALTVGVAAAVSIVGVIAGGNLLYKLAVKGEWAVLGFKRS